MTMATANIQRSRNTFNWVYYAHCPKKITHTYIKTKFVIAGADATVQYVSDFCLHTLYLVQKPNNVLPLHHLQQ